LTYLAVTGASVKLQQQKISCLLLDVRDKARTIPAMSLANSSLRTYLRRFWFLLVCLPLVIAVVWYVYLLQPCGNGKRVYGLTVP